ncbi:Beta-defensin 127 [Galemys pyrenaicus]|uniref:Beta-defensin n=1 Tax=Galemys pyrenaicus TaxID=202257 RepID=A0A8J6AVV4_GALPY|nr:Beta-defensin 127 [Galemys pyrenaicus]
MHLLLLIFTVCGLLTVTTKGSDSTKPPPVAFTGDEEYDVDFRVKFTTVNYLIPHNPGLPSYLPCAFLNLDGDVGSGITQKAHGGVSRGYCAELLIGEAGQTAKVEKLRTLLASSLQPTDWHECIRTQASEEGGSGCDSLHQAPWLSPPLAMRLLLIVAVLLLQKATVTEQLKKCWGEYIQGHCRKVCRVTEIRRVLCENGKYCCLNILDLEERQKITKPPRPKPPTFAYTFPQDDYMHTETISINEGEEFHVFSLLVSPSSERP